MSDCADDVLAYHNDEVTLDAVRKHAAPKGQGPETKTLDPDSPLDDDRRKIISQHIERVEVGSPQLSVLLKEPSPDQAKRI